MASPPPSPRTVAVVGAGWAGCAAAVELALRGHRVHLFEGSRQLGGRARALLPAQAAIDILNVTTGASVGPSPDAAWMAGLDNGQHILLGAYRESLRVMRIVGVDPRSAFLRLPLQMRYPPGDGIDFRCPRALPAPLHLLTALWRARGLSRADKLTLARFGTVARWIDWRLHTDCPVSELLERFDQTPTAIALLWRPLCLAALNTPPERASAQVFLNVLRDSLGARRAASDMLLPRVDLGALFPAPAAAFVRRHGGGVHLASRVCRVVRTDPVWRLEFAVPGGAAPDGSGGPVAPSSFDAVVVATPAPVADRLLAPWLPAPAAADLAQEAITTCYLRYAATTALALPFYALRDDPERQCWGQFVFDRGHLDPALRGVLAVVISAASGAPLDQAALREAVASQLATAFGDTSLLHPLDTKIISDKRATFSCTPGLIRATTATGIDGLVRAGDHVGADSMADQYPATIEAAVRSGVAAALLVTSGLYRRDTP